MRMAGKICCLCRSSLPAPHTYGEKRCARCTSGWHCQFLEADLKTPLPRKLNFPGPEKIVETAERGGYVMNLEGRQALENGIEKGRGGIWLLLTEEQYQKLRNK
jgi:hypothetical protein